MPSFIHQLYYLILTFFLFSVAGWCMEVTLKFIQFHRFINRGFLIGPYCPIYGGGAVLVIVTVGSLSRLESSYGSTFIISFFVCGLLEYAVSYYMEKVFHARWWDYSTKPMNLNGRIWIGNLILFGIGGTAIVKLIVPFLYGCFDRLPGYILEICSVLIIVIMGTDAVASHFIMRLVKISAENSEADDTETISREIRALLSNRSFLHRRLAEAYPNVTFRTDRIMNRIKEEKDKVLAEKTRLLEESRRLRQELTERISAEKDKASSQLSLQKSIIASQQKLIALLERGASPSDASIHQLEDEIQKHIRQGKELENEK